MKKITIVKRIMALALTIFTVTALVINPMEAEAAKKKSGNATYKEGDDIAFGMLDGAIINWTILKYDDTTKQALIVSRKTLTSKSITDYRNSVTMMYLQSKTSPGYVRWSENYWRGWCNQIFYKNNFTDGERAMIQKTALGEKDAQKSLMNFYHDTTLDGDYIKNDKVKQSLNMAIYNSQTTTVDYIFFLSSDEYTEYKDKMKYEVKGIWPLRTNSYDDPAFGLFVDDTQKMMYKNYYYMGSGIRPAMYVKLGEPEAETTDSSSNDSKTTNSNTTATTTSTTKTATATTATTATTETTTAKATSTKKYANNGTNVGNITLPDDSSYSMILGTTAQIAIDLDYLNSTDKQYTITYKSSDSSVFTVDSNGKISAIGKGTGVVTVQMTKQNGKVYTMSCRIDSK